MMLEFLTWIFLAIYIVCSLLLMVYGLHCYLMLFLFLVRQKHSRAQLHLQIETYNSDCPTTARPLVTIQLPIYNEAEVVERLLESAAAVDYPRDRLEIQVVDDSSDETRELIDRIVPRLQKRGVDISVLRRADRKDFKAGALAMAMQKAKGEFVAIFDADFLVPSHFLRHTLALIDGHPDVACVQGRWGHLNIDENWLTRAQSVGINGHFAAEQGARSYNRLCMNFNGTAGLWRASAIHEAGGWQGDTLTEDLDLSYRVQLLGQRIVYDFDLECLAEIPNNVIALKSQQKRWAKGSIETAIKLGPTILHSHRLSLFQKVEAMVHLTHYMVAPLMLVLSACTLPVLVLAPNLPVSGLVAGIWLFIIISALAPCVMYTGSGLVLRRGFFSLSHFPAMLAVGTGLCLNNSLAVWEAICKKRSPFIRTPKSGSDPRQSRQGRYRLPTDCWPAYCEIGLGIYCLYTFFYYLESEKYIFGFFIASYAVGLITFGLASVKERAAHT
ncbi:MAG: glycosyltransferase [Planctomycetes bacterium]|nr:glycosyltransferase [Planctomycetota bacterium]